MLSITGGEFKGRVVKTPSRKMTRHTPSLARRALFDAIDPREAVFLDLFSGSGIMSLEAISRGAAKAICVEVSKTACAAIRANRSAFCLDNDTLTVICADFRRAIGMLAREYSSFDLVFADPPFERGFLSDVVAHLGQYAQSFLLSSIVIEVSPDLLEEVEEAVSKTSFSVVSIRTYSGVKLVFLEVSTDES